MIRADIDRVTDLRLELLGELGAADLDGDQGLLRRAIRLFLERQLGSGRHFTVGAEEGGDVVGVGSLEVFERLPHPQNLAGRVGYLLNVYVQPGMRRRGIATALIRELVLTARREGGSGGCGCTLLPRGAASTKRRASWAVASRRCSWCCQVRGLQGGALPGYQPCG